MCHHRCRHNASIYVTGRTQKFQYLKGSRWKFSVQIAVISARQTPPTRAASSAARRKSWTASPLPWG
nr:MAG TPA: hypothetical protein [Caudoviricetes sp.]